LRVPAVCNTCGSFFPSPIEVKNAKEIGFYNIGIGPCPKCGGTGHIPDGLYNFIDNTIEFLSGPSRSVSELQQLASLLNKAKENNYSAEQISEKIQEELPELASLRDILPKTRTELYAFLTIILTALSILIGQINKGATNKIEVNQVVNLINQQNTMIDVHPHADAIQKKQEEKKKTGRNDPCICGSGKKYKKCCLNKNG